MTKKDLKDLSQKDIHNFIEEHVKHCKDCKGKLESSREFRERQELMDKDIKVSTEKHEMSMKELEFRRESDRMHHERELERGRIFRAEERKTILLKGQEFRKRDAGRPQYPS